MSELTLTPIAAELVATKLEQIANFEQPKLSAEMAEQPRLAEVLWFLQFVSQPDNYAGGLVRFCHDFINDVGAEIGTATMMRCRGRAFTFEELKAIYCELSSEGQSQLVEVVDEEDDELLNLLRRVERWGNPSSLADISFLFNDEPAPVRRQSPVIGKAEQKRLLSVCTPEKLRAVCMEIARVNLGQYFQQLCSKAAFSFRRPAERRIGRTTRPARRGISQTSPTR